MRRPWFTPHAYGYGAAPVCWQGWAAVGAYAALLAGASLVLLGWQPGGGTAPAAWQIGAWILAVLLLTGGFIGLARAKSDGQWGWRWGK